MRGECSAGATFHTALKPTIPASPSTVTRFMNAGPVNLPRASAVPIPPVVTAMERVLSCHGVKATIGSSILSNCLSAMLNEGDLRVVERRLGSVGLWRELERARGLLRGV